MDKIFFKNILRKWRKFKLTLEITIFCQGKLEKTRNFHQFPFKIFQYFFVWKKKQNVNFCLELENSKTTTKISYFSSYIFSVETWTMLENIHDINRRAHTSFSWEKKWSQKFCNWEKNTRNGRKKEEKL